ncbi:MAG: hypothetical protein IPO33_14580 [Saprospiraceae bacterium]|nr:hypothetical protein [Candidatus Brachybacter algidus]
MKMETFFHWLNLNVNRGKTQKHLTNHDGFTSKAKDWKIVHYEVYDNIQLAHARELQIKKWKSKKAITRIIQNKGV